MTTKNPQQSDLPKNRMSEPRVVEHSLDLLDGDLIVSLLGNVFSWIIFDPDVLIGLVGRED